MLDYSHLFLGTKNNNSLAHRSTSLMLSHLRSRIGLELGTNKVVDLTNVNQRKLGYELGLPMARFI